MSPKLPRSKRTYTAFFHDIVMAAVSFLLALYLRLGTDESYYSTELLIQGTGLFTIVAALVFYYSRLYQGIWRYASMNDLVAITRSATLAVLIFLPIMFLVSRLEELPRSIPFIHWFVLMALLGGPRFLYRIFKDRRLDLKLDRDGQKRIPVLLIGAGDGAELFIRAMARDADANYRVVGIAALSPTRVGRHIHGIAILDTVENLSGIVDALEKRGAKPQRLVLTKDDLPGDKVRDLVDRAAGLGLHMARLPRLTDFKSGARDHLEIKPIAIEDLLGRPQAALDRDAMGALIEGKRVLITGSGGSIGSELVRQVSDFNPSHIALLDSGEFNLYAIDLELAQRHPHLPRQAFIADVRDRKRLHALFADFRPELVFHAAALKHVPLVEANVIEGAKTNVGGTRNVADLCVEFGVASMVQISTDKAVNPTNVMGATKRIAENYTQALDISEGRHDGTRFVTVRFGNVLGSTGSVVPLFRKQLEAGGPITVTHPDMQRYFMTIREAVELVLQASAMGNASRGEQGKIFVLDMGEPVKIVDLANQMIRLAGLRPGEDIDIVFTGLRPGEKLFEEIFHGAEAPVPTERKGILLASPRAADKATLNAKIDALLDICRDGDAQKAVALIRDLVPDYHQPQNK